MLGFQILGLVFFFVFLPFLMTPEAVSMSNGEAGKAAGWQDGERRTPHRPALPTPSLPWAPDPSPTSWLSPERHLWVRVSLASDAHASCSLSSSPARQPLTHLWWIKQASAVNLLLNLPGTSVFTDFLLSMFITHSASSCLFWLQPPLLGSGSADCYLSLPHGGHLPLLIHPNCWCLGDQLIQIVRNVCWAIEINQNGVIPSKSISSFLSVSTPHPKPRYGAVTMRVSILWPAPATKHKINGLYALGS